MVVEDTKFSTGFILFCLEIFRFYRVWPSLKRRKPRDKSEKISENAL